PPVDLSDLITCGYCHHVFTEPCQLPCGDIVCRRCFMSQDEEMQAADGSGSIRRCPLCRRGFNADGSELRADARTAWIVQSQLQQAASGAAACGQTDDKNTCSLLNCNEAATGCGLEFEGPLCERHLRTDFDRFAAKLTALQAELQPKVALLVKQIKSRKAVLHELMADREDVSDMFDEMQDQLMECRHQTLKKLDDEIEKLQSDAQSLEPVESLLVEIENKTNASDRIKSQFQSLMTLHYSLENLQVDEHWQPSINSTVDRVRPLSCDIFKAVNSATIPVNFECSHPIVKEIEHDTNFELIRIESCTRTEGFHMKDGVISTQSCEGSRSLPRFCVVAFGYQSNSKQQDDTLVRFFDTSGTGNTGIHIGEWKTPNRKLASAHCNDAQQQFYLLFNNSDLIVTDLAGSVLHEVKSLQIEAPLRVTGYGSKIYILGSDSRLLCLSSETLEVQERTQLSVSDVVDVVALKRKLIFMTNNSVYFKVHGSNELFDLWSPPGSHTESNLHSSLVCLTTFDHGFGLIGIRNSKGHEWLYSVLHKAVVFESSADAYSNSLHYFLIERKFMYIWTRVNSAAAARIPPPPLPPPPPPPTPLPRVCRVVPPPPRRW
ncbi:hypothetical protein BOX15_Mlig016575g2, partial [Macrostomum lignano]